MRIPTLCVFVLTQAAFAQTNDGLDLLKRVREQVMDSVTRLPQYMCSLKIEREQYAAAPGHARNCDGITAQHSHGHIGRLEETDRVKLDVAIGDANEMYSWVGEDRFDDRDVFDMVRDGALQNGGYSTFLASIFGGDAPKFTYDGEKQVNGRTLAEFRFQVPHDRSNYVFGNRRNFSVIAAYGGSFLADPTTGDLAQLVIHTVDLPADSGACEATTTLDYGRTRLNESDFLLPRTATLDILQTDASEFQNVTIYSSCHEFQGKSVVSFDEPPADRGSAAPEIKLSPVEFTLPAGTAFKLAFTQAIDTATAAAGDRIKAKLAAAIVDPSSKAVLAPAGAEIVARIIRIEQLPQVPRSVRMLVKLETVNIGGAPRLFSLELNWVAQLPITTAMTGFPTLYGPTPTTKTAFFDALADPNVGSFYFAGVAPNFVIQAGLESNWMAASRASAQPVTLPSAEMLAAHNAVRETVGVPPLIWSDRLADMAQEWANTLLARGEFRHRPRLSVGENLFEIKGPRAHASPSEVVQAWESESRAYNYRNNHCVTGPTACGHYTQIVWRTTAEVGCAAARGDGLEIWVCNYDPPGNWVGSRPY